MRGPQITTEEEREAHALTTKFHKNPNFKGKSTTQIKCTHYKQLGHKQEACWFLHPELRPAGWVERSNESRKGERENWRDKIFSQPTNKKEEARSFSIAKEAGAVFDAVASATFDPVRRQSKELNQSESSGSDRGDQIQHLFQQFFM
jgi:hypothetical protein